MIVHIQVVTLNIVGMPILVKSNRLGVAGHV